VAIAYGPIVLCSGALVAPDLVLTAAHCAGSGESEGLGHFAVFGPNADDLAHTRRIRVKEQIKHPKAAGEGLGYDVALFKLETPVTDITPMALEDHAWGPEAVGATLRHVGYGVSNEEDNTGGGIKREVSYPVTKLEPLLIWSGAPGQQTCTRDSGAPSLMRRDGVERIVAVVSDGPNCHEDGADARVDVPEIHDWIMQRMPAPALEGSGGCATSRSSRGSPALFALVLFAFVLQRTLVRTTRSPPGPPPGTLLGPNLPT
jgi:hypothetical protein